MRILRRKFKCLIVFEILLPYFTLDNPFKYARLRVQVLVASIIAVDLLLNVLEVL